jgi:hypothetical protein
VCGWWSGCSPMLSGSDCWARIPRTLNQLGAECYWCVWSGKAVLSPCSDLDVNVIQCRNLTGLSWNVLSLQ